MTGVVPAIPKFQFESSAGAPLANGTVTVCLAGTTTPTSTWQDISQSTLNTNPIVLNSRGEAVIYLDPTLSYKFVLANAGGVIQWTQDNISGASGSFSLAGSSGSSLVGFIQAGTGAVARTAQAKMREWISAADFGAVGDGVTDDTAALQLFLNYVVSNGLRGRLANTEYKITAPLQVGTVSPAFTPFTEASFVIEGDNKSTVSGRGCRIKLYGTGHAAIIQINKGASRYGTFRNFTLDCATAPALDVYAATGGIAFTDTYFSAFTFENIDANGVRNSFSILEVTGSNGEFNVYRRCTGNKTQRFFYMAANTGQSFGHKFEDCGWTANTTGVATDQGSSYYAAFEVGDSNGGYGLEIRSFDCTVIYGRTTPAVILPRTMLFRNNGVTGAVTFSGGRVEGLSTIVDNRNPFSSPVSISGMDFAGMVSTSANPVIVSGSSTNGLFHIADCDIPVYAGAFYSGTDLGFYVQANYDDQSKYIFERCHISAHNGGAKSVPFVTRPGRRQQSEVAYLNCTVQRTVSATPANTYIINRRHLSDWYNGETVNATDAGPNSAQSGIPQNLLLYPSFNGNPATAPWVHGGSATFSVYQTSGANLDVFASSGYARYIQMAPGTSVYQDLSAITGAMQFMHWLGCMSVFVSNNDWFLIVQLSNPTTGEVYDEVRLNSNSTASKVAPPKQSLTACSTASGGNFRLTWAAASSNGGNVGIYLNWQTCSEYPNSGYVNTLGATETYAHSWETADYLRATGRLAIPVKADTELGGASSPTAVVDLKSDVYLSSTTNRFRYYAGDMWLSMPRVEYGTAIPVAGTWKRGDIVINSAAAVGQPSYWQCVAAGTPGTWGTAPNLA